MKKNKNITKEISALCLWQLTVILLLIIYIKTVNSEDVQSNVYSIDIPVNILLVDFPYETKEIHEVVIQEEKVESKAILNIQKNKPVSRHMDRKMFNEHNLTYCNTHSVEVIRDLLKGELKQYAQAFYDAGINHGVNSIFLASLARQESGNGTYALMAYNNIFSIGAWDNRSIWESKRFDSVEQCIDWTANMLKRDYLTEGGVHFNGYSIYDVNIKYASDKTWAKKIIDIMYEIY